MYLVNFPTVLLGYRKHLKDKKWHSVGSPCCTGWGGENEELSSSLWEG